MTRTPLCFRMGAAWLALWLVALSMPVIVSAAGNDKELRAQRQAAQKERQAQKNERAKALRDGHTQLRAYAGDLKKDYTSQLKDLDVDFELRQVELEEERDQKISKAETEYQKQWSQLFMNPEQFSEENAMKKLEAEAKTYSDTLFRLKKEAAAAVQQEKLALQERKDALLDERDRTILEEAESLGLTEDHAPILATPIGDELTKSEIRWNEREEKEVARLKEQNQRALREYRNGQALRAWERKNSQEDFELTWKKKAELHALQTEQTLFSSLQMAAMQGKEFDRQGMMDRIAELSQRRKEIGIRYDAIRKKNNIKRRVKRKDLRNQ